MIRLDQLSYDGAYSAISYAHLGNSLSPQYLLHLDSFHPLKSQSKRGKSCSLENAKIVWSTRVPSAGRRPLVATFDLIDDGEIFYDEN
jgi:hypothetical protein